MKELEENKINKFIGELMEVDTLENPPSHNFTQYILQQASIYSESKRKKRKLKYLITLITISFCLVISLIVSLYSLWKLEQFTWLKQSIADLLNPIIQNLPFEIPLWLLGAVALHFVLVRIAVAIVLYKKRYKMLNIPIINN